MENVMKLSIIFLSVLAVIAAADTVGPPIDPLTTGGAIALGIPTLVLAVAALVLWLVS